MARESLRHRVAKSERGDNSLYYQGSATGTFPATSPGRACVGEETAHCTIKIIQNKKERISQTGKGGPSVDTGGFLFVQNGLSRLFPVWVSGQFMAFFTSAISILKTLVVAIGAGLAVWGVINLLEGYGNDNPGAKSQGIKQFMAN